ILEKSTTSPATTRTSSPRWSGSSPPPGPITLTGRSPERWRRNSSRFLVAVTDAVDRADNDRVARVALDPFPQLRDVLIQGAAVGDVVHPPAEVEEHVARNHLAASIVEQLEDGHVAQAEVDGGVAAAGPKLGGVHREVVQREGGRRRGGGMPGHAPA